LLDAKKRVWIQIIAVALHRSPQKNSGHSSLFKTDQGKANMALGRRDAYTQPIRKAIPRRFSENDNAAFWPRQMLNKHLPGPGIAEMDRQWCDRS
jgi:hypothetical protein